MRFNKIYCGDALKLIDELDLQPRLIILSPPDLAETNFSLKEYKEFIKNIYSKCLEKLHENGVLCSVTTDRKMNGKIYTKHIDIINSVNADLFKYKIWAKSLKTNLFILTYSHMLFFRKNKKNINNGLKEFKPDVWHIPLDKVKGYKNKDSFPTELVRRIVLNFTQENNLVLDPFLGTGKTAAVCLSLNRTYIGFELDQKNIDIAKSFIQSYLQ